MSEDHGIPARTATRAVHAGEARHKFAGSLINPISQTATYVFDSLDAFTQFKAGDLEGYEYGRYGNPTQQVAEQKIAALEGAEAGLLFSSGMSAVTSTLLAMMSSDEHIVILGDCYRQTVRFCHMLARYGISVTSVAAWDWEALARSISPATRIVLTESPTNPHLRVVDIERLVSLGREHDLCIIMDSTFATPINLRPLEYGVNLVIHSATKYLGGHNDLMAGGVFGGETDVAAVREFQRVTGAIVDPLTSFLLIRGLKTLALRVERQNHSAMEMALFLDQHPRIRHVHHPGLPGHPDHTVAERQMDGYGGVVSFEVDGDLEATRRAVEALRIPYLAPSLGGVESLATHPATMSYYDLSREERMQIGITDELVRYAVGIEDVSDLIDDLDAALSRL